MKLIILLFFVSLLQSCASHLTKEDKQAVVRVHTRCTLEFLDILKTNDQRFTAEYCRRFLSKIAGSDQHDVPKLVFNYKAKINVARILKTGTIKDIQDLPIEYATETAKQIDDTFNETTEFFYEKEMDNRINTKLGV
jgi:hypothetical protein